MVHAASATCNVIVITDPSGTDPNGAAAGSMSFADNMFQSTFLLSKENKYAVLSGGKGESTPRLEAIVDTISRLENGATPSQAASAASLYSGIRVMCGTPTGGAAVGGYFKAYVVIVEDDGTIKVTPYSGGLAVLPAGKKGAIIHLRNTAGNPKMGTADRVRRETAINMGKMIRDGYPATTIIGETLKEVATDAGEKYGGGAVNMVSGLTTGDMFTPENLNETGYPMDSNYLKVCPLCGWSVGYPSAENYQTCPIDGSKLKTVSATDALIDAITVTKDSIMVSVYGVDESGVEQTTKEVVKASVKKYGYNANTIAGSLNKAINNGLIVGVNYVEPKDLNVKQSSKAVGVYYSALPNGRTAPAWNLPISSNVLDLLGNIQTAIGFVMVLLVLFRSTLITSFKR
ncbi:hypothetical protein [Methanobacterium alcaliphilum]|uniref:hypothetical protein n=1 Tax=Methanobacterium alcaliphilum TaxID=392018 RepID=UPI00200AF2A3|nr:hypothetical protein [Methanobacterium alcaliphilum]MCK9152125.1 hypothetical protein [Methanobacterium alcaliphilum]